MSQLGWCEFFDDTCLTSLIGQALENSFRLTTSVSRNYAETLDAHGDVLEAIRLRKPDQARSRMRALIDIASADLVNATVKRLS